MKRRVHPGFNLTEIMMAMVLLGTIAILSFPMVIQSSFNSQALFKAKNIASQISDAYATYELKNSTPPTQGGQIAGLTRYVNVLGGGSFPFSTGQVTCSGGATCYQFADGGVLMPFQWSGNGMYFFYDPDGSDPLPAVILYLDYTANRMMTLDSLTAEDGSQKITVPGLGGITTGGATRYDPAYVQPWTRL